ncbi:MAG TPA: sigma factor-like helix-turn-helix DNA-binding protein [bacterium]|nr:sigma factor-like helix-turn-helix DNA-binding protein [bacterium]
MTTRAGVLDNVFLSDKFSLLRLVKKLLQKVNPRERDVLARRFGLNTAKRQTLEQIGATHGLTRERVRQIEAAGLKKLKKMRDLESQVVLLRKSLDQLISDNGGLMDKQYLESSFLVLSREAVKESGLAVYSNNFDFLVSKVMADDFDPITSDLFNDSVKLKYQAIDHLESLAEQLVEQVRQAKRLFLVEDLIKLSFELDAYKNNTDKLTSANKFDLASVLSGENFKDGQLINQNKPVYSVLRAVRQIEQNKFGAWGLSDLPEVKPRTIADKIYLILKEAGQPLHFRDIASQINKIFADKPANAATVHNELILDDRYVLVGRGIYALKESGYQAGRVVDIITGILKKAKYSLSKDDIIKEVLNQRLVKKTTVSLILSNKELFQRLPDGSYSLKEKAS